MAVPETNRLNKNTHTELTEFHTLPSEITFSDGLMI